MPVFYGNNPTIDPNGDNLEIQNDYNYDPYLTGNSKQVVSDCGVKFTIESAREKTVNSVNRVELTVFDHTINTSTLLLVPTSGTILTEVQLSSVTGTFTPGSGSCLVWFL